jgi:stearoyl-CoA desaturase (delta-9 desaturase)
VAQHCTFFINSLCHTIGRQPYSTKHSARDSAIMAFLTFGEGYHNYHHEFQHDYRNGVKPWQWDPTKWTIWTLSKLGLVEGLRRVPDSKILLAEMREARTRADQQLARLAANPGCATAARAREALASAGERLAANYQELETAMANKVELSRQALRNWQHETRAFMRELQRYQHAVRA